MISPDGVDQIEQKKTDSLAAKAVHKKRIQRLKLWIRRTDFLALAVPIAYFVLRYLLKTTWAHGPVEVVWEISAGVLLIVTTFRIVYKWQENLDEHGALIAENIAVVRQADYLLSHRESASADNVRHFFAESDRVDVQDAKLLGELAERERQETYRQAIKEWGADRVCRLCGASPWDFQPGSCQACGNTPPKPNPPVAR